MVGTLYSGSKLKVRRCKILTFFGKFSVSGPRKKTDNPKLPKIFQIFFPQNNIWGTNWAQNDRTNAFWLVLDGFRRSNFLTIFWPFSPWDSHSGSPQGSHAISSKLPENGLVVQFFGTKLCITYVFKVFRDKFFFDFLVIFLMGKVVKLGVGALLWRHGRTSKNHSE